MVDGRMVESYKKYGTEKMEDCYNRDINMCQNLCHSSHHTTCLRKEHFSWIMSIHQMYVNVRLVKD